MIEEKKLSSRLLAHNVVVGELERTQATAIGDDLKGHIPSTADTVITSHV